MPPPVDAVACFLFSMKRDTVLLLLLQVLLQVLAFDIEAAIPTYSTASGVHCYACPPGFYVEQPCTEDLTNSMCQPCKEHHYSDKYNSRSHCDQCNSWCPKNGAPLHECTPTTDKECICLDGFHRFPYDVFEPLWMCKPHSECKNGQGEVSPGNHTHNRECEDCPENQFVNRSDPLHPVCQDCTLCQPGSKVTRLCSLDANQECADGNDTSYSVVNSTPPPSKPESDSLGAGGIAGIVAAVFLLLFIVVVTVCLFQRRQKKQSPSTNDAEAVTVHDGGIPLAPTNIQAGSTGNGAASQHPAPGEPGVATPLLSNGTEDIVTSDWDEEFITGKVFPFLSTNLRSEWSFFIRQLPGWPYSGMAHTTTEHKRDEYNTVRETIYACLVEWQRKCTSQEFFTKASILSALVDDSVNRRDLKEQLERLPVPASRDTESPDTSS